MLDIRIVVTVLVTMSAFCTAGGLAEWFACDQKAAFFRVILR